jgi:hypothetical protein
MPITQWFPIRLSYLVNDFVTRYDKLKNPGGLFCCVEALAFIVVTSSVLYSE